MPRLATPQVHQSVFVAPTASVVGDVVLAAEVSVWYGTVLRGDVGWIRVGELSNIQDLAVLHMSTGLSNVTVGREVTIGHGAIVHGAWIGDGALVGMGSILLDNAQVGQEAIVAAGSLLPPKMEVPPRTLAKGHPAKIIRQLRPEEWEANRQTARRYAELARQHAETLSPKP